MEDKKAGRARLVFLLWLLVSFFYFYLASDYVQASMKDDEFAEYLTFVVDLAGSEGRTSRELRALVMAKVRELQLPVEEDNIEVSGRARTLEVCVTYGVDIDIPLIARISNTRCRSELFYGLSISSLNN